MTARLPKLQVFSDLHLEFYRDYGRERLKQLVLDREASAVVLAGDIGTAGRQRRTLELAFDFFTSHFDHVFFVSGNHEYYGARVPETEEKLRKLAARYPRFTLLEPGVVSHWEGRRVVGATLWFRSAREHAALADELADFSAIKGFRRWVYDQNRRHLAWLEETVAAGDIVVTHHLPAQGSVAEQFRDDPFNTFFLCNVQPLIEARRPLWWIHGHTHVPCDYTLGATRVVANPLGYPDEAATEYLPVTLDLSAAK